MSWNQFLKVEEILRFEYERRIVRNPRYSMRAFSRDIGLTPAHLNEIMKGRSGLSEHKAAVVLQSLKATESEADWFRLLVQKNFSRTSQTRKRAQKTVHDLMKWRQKFTTVKRENFRLVSRWYHFGILEAFALKSFTPDAEAIASRFGVSRETARQALADLLNAGLIEKDGFGRLQLNHTNSEVSSVQAEESIREYHRQILSLASESTKLATDRRELGALSLAVQKSDLENAKKRIREFRKSFNREFGVDRDGDDVFCLSVQFFPLTRGPSESQS